jgi:Mg-chelatase subunit ChlD
MTLNDPVARKKAIIDAAKAASQAAGSALKKVEKPKQIEYIKPEDATNKIRIVFDNSGSMSSSCYDKEKHLSSSIEEAKKGVVEFLRNCTPNKDAVAVHLLNTSYYKGYEDEYSYLPSLIERAKLESDLVKLASSVDSPALHATGGTPLFERLDDALMAPLGVTRIVAFSDGEAASYQEDAICEKARAKHVPIDTVYIGEANEEGHRLMQRIAKKTGGICLVFDPAKGVNFAEAFKYLSPSKRLMLMDKSFKEKLERGEVK